MEALNREPLDLHDSSLSLESMYCQKRDGTAWHTTVKNKVAVKTEVEENLRRENASSARAGSTCTRNSP